MKEFDFTAFSKKAHENAIAHGWYEPAPTVDERIAAIHSEWSEAFQAWRDSEVIYWQNPICTSKDLLMDCEERDCDKCEHNVICPSGYAVELIDGVIRILEWCADMNFEVEGKFDEKMDNSAFKDVSFAETITVLHSSTALAYNQTSEEQLVDHLLFCVSVVLNWCEYNGLEPTQIMEEKHAYNCTRSYRHGGKKC